MYTLKETIIKYARIICESSPGLIANKLNDKANNYQTIDNNGIDSFLKRIADEGLNDPEHFPTGNGNSIDITNNKAIDNYVQQIIDNLNINNETGRQAILNALDSFKEMLKNVASKKPQQEQILHNKREPQKIDTQVKFKGR